MDDDGAVEQILLHHVPDDLPQRLEDAQLHLLQTLALGRTGIGAAFQPRAELLFLYQLVRRLSLEIAEVHLNEVVHGLEGGVGK